LLWYPEIVPRIRYQAIIIIAVTVLVFSNSLSGRFVMDDTSLVVYNPRVRSVSNIPGMFLGSAFFDPNKNEDQGGQFYRPLVSVAYSLLYALGGSGPWIFHLFQIFMHAANAVLLLLLLRRFSGEKFSLMAALVFAVHPVNQITVAYISALNDVLYQFFGLLALLVLPGRLFLSVLLLFASLLAKETGVLFSAVAGLYLLLFKRKKLSMYIYFQIYAAALYALLRFGLARVTYTVIRDIPIMRSTLLQRILTMPKIFWYYISAFLFPARLVCCQQWVVWSPGFQDFYLPLLLDIVVFALIIAGGVFIRRRQPSYFRSYLFFTVWFCLGLFMHLQIWPLDWTVLDTWFYFMFIGILGMIGVVFKAGPRNFSPLLAVPILLILGVRTWIRNSDWRDGLTLFRHDLKLEQNAYLEGAIAAEYMTTGQYAESIPHWRESLRLNGWGIPAWYNMAYAYEKLGDFPQAEAHYQTYLGLNEADYAYESLLALMLKTDPTGTRSAQIARKAVDKFPEDPKFWLVLAISQYLTGDSREASASAAKSYKISPTRDALYVADRIQKNLPIELVK